MYKRNQRSVDLTLLTLLVACGVALVAAKKANVPMPVYEDGLATPPFSWSGWMGDTGSIVMDENNRDVAHSGNTAMKCEFKAESGFGGIVWQSPANDWGDADGGYDLTGAKRLTFWARGSAGGEVVSFGMGYIGNDKKFPRQGRTERPDTGTGMEAVHDRPGRQGP